MNTRDTHLEGHPGDHQRLAALVSTLLAGGLNLEERTELNQLLREQQAMRAQFVAMVTQARLIAARLAPELKSEFGPAADSARRGSSFPIAEAGQPIVPHPPARTPGGWFPRSQLMGVLLGTVVALFAVGFLMLLVRPAERVREQDGHDLITNWAPPAGTETVATIGSTESVMWSRTHKPRPGDTSVRRGEALGIDSGRLDLRLASGARLMVDGPAEWSVESDNRVALRSGKVVCNVPPAAVGFTLSTPNALVVDLGTEFGVQVDGQGQTDLSVLQGEIELVVAQQSPRAAGAATQAPRYRVQAGESRRVETAEGVTEVKSLSFNEERFADLLRTDIYSTKRPRQRSGHSTPAGTVLITPTIHTFSSEYGGEAARRVTNLVNGSGLVPWRSGIVGGEDCTHDNRHDTVWHQATKDNADGTFVSFDLGSEFELHTTRIWNLNQENATENGARNIDISVSADGTRFRHLTSIQLYRACSAAEAAQDFDTIASKVRYVRFVIRTGYDTDAKHLGQGWKGLAEVRFEGVPSRADAPIVITPSVSSVSSELTEDADRRAAVFTVDGSGLQSQKHSSGAMNVVWTTHGNLVKPYDITAPYIVYDLGVVCDVRALRIWNYNEGGGNFHRLGPRNVEIFTGRTAAASESRGNFVFPVATGKDDYAGATINVDFRGVRFIKFKILDTHDGAVFGTNESGTDGRFLTGLSEVRFLGMPVGGSRLPASGSGGAAPGNSSPAAAGDRQ